MDERLTAAIDANVAWCDLVCRTNGLETNADGSRWMTTRRSPLLYPDAISRRPHVRSILRGTEPGAGRSVKDSFADLDLSADGLVVLFEARWIFRPAEPRASPGPWTDGDIEAWRQAAGGPPSIGAAAVAHPDVRLLTIERGGEIVAGAILNRCGGAVGVSNVATFGTEPAELWATLPAAATAHLGPLPLVGYESGPDLDEAAAAGFEELGPLRVWIAAHEAGGLVRRRKPPASSSVRT